MIFEIATTKYGVHSSVTPGFLLFLEKDAGFYKTAQPVLHPPTQRLDTLQTKTIILNMLRGGAGGSRRRRREAELDKRETTLFQQTGRQNQNAPSGRKPGERGKNTLENKLLGGEGSWGSI